MKTKILIILAACFIALTAAVPLWWTFSYNEPLTPPAPAVIDEPSAPIKVVEQMRAIWIATVNNINFPSKKGLSKAALEAELDEIVAFAKENGFNTIMFQVRPAADALYDSDIFPASKFVSGECGRAPSGNFDCLAYLVETAHKEHIAVHALINPLRVTSGNKTYPQTDIDALPLSSPARQNKDFVVAYADGKLYFDVGEPYVRSLVAAGVKEICENYAVDGVVFDDYFYPYPEGNASFDDSKSFAAYGNGMALADYRRNNVNQLIKLCYDTVKAVDRRIQFGVSPFGIWQNGGEGSDTSGLEAYDAIFCDALAWVNGGYVDYLAPQIYWSFDTESAPFDTLALWWSEKLSGTGVRYYINHGVYRYSDGSMQSGEITKQLDFASTLPYYFGSAFYGYAALESNDGGVLKELCENFKEHTLYLE